VRGSSNVMVARGICQCAGSMNPALQYNCCEIICFTQSQVAKLTCFTSLSIIPPSEIVHLHDSMQNDGIQIDCTPQLVAEDLYELLSDVILSVLMKCDNFIYHRHYTLSRFIIKCSVSQATSAKWRAQSNGCIKLSLSQLLD
jgi:hypothetical protein